MAARRARRGRLARRSALVAARPASTADAPGWLLVLNQAVLLPAAILAAYAFGLALGGRLLAALVRRDAGARAARRLALRPAAVPGHLPRARLSSRRSASATEAGSRPAALLTVAAALVLASLVQSAPILGAAGGVAAGVAIVVEPSACAVRRRRRSWPVPFARRPSHVRWPSPSRSSSRALVTLLVRDAGIGLDRLLERVQRQHGLHSASTPGRTASSSGCRSPARSGSRGARSTWSRRSSAAGSGPSSSPRPRHRTGRSATARFFVAFVPALPAFALLVAAIPLLVPGVAARRARARHAAQPLLEQRHALREDRVLVGELRDHRRVVQQHEQDEERRDGEQHRGRVRRRRRPSRRSCSARRATRRARAGRGPSRARAARSAPAAAASGSARRRRAAAGATRSSPRSRCGAASFLDRRQRRGGTCRRRARASP